MASGVARKQIGCVSFKGPSGNTDILGMNDFGGSASVGVVQQAP